MKARNASFTTLALDRPHLASQSRPIPLRATYANSYATLAFAYYLSYTCLVYSCTRECSSRVVFARGRLLADRPHKGSVDCNPKVDMRTQYE